MLVVGGTHVESAKEFIPRISVLQEHIKILKNLKRRTYKLHNLYCRNSQLPQIKSPTLQCVTTMAIGASISNTVWAKNCIQCLSPFIVKSDGDFKRWAYWLELKTPTTTLLQKHISISNGKDKRALSQTFFVHLGKLYPLHVTFPASAAAPVPL